MDADGHQRHQHHRGMFVLGPDRTRPIGLQNYYDECNSSGMRAATKNGYNREREGEKEEKGRWQRRSVE